MKRIGDEREQTMQRVRVGVIGLAAVILLIGLASMIISGVRRESSRRTAGGGDAAVVANIAAENEQAGSEEPLADLGLAPGAPDTNASAPAR